MANISSVEAAAAYRNSALKAIREASQTKPEDLSTTGASSESHFLDMVKGAAQNAIASNRQAEHISQEAMVGKADLTDVVTAIANAEMTLKTVVGVRDKVIKAYQEILKMPI
ncbi:MAG: flagellar hook-basal body complex protein FliE [Alphaproteobacteria bacterium]|nr:flagellar hook-basal body complex protein FliE [Alphaproteobacteria bacterium]